MNASTTSLRCLGLLLLCCLALLNLSSALSIPVDDVRLVNGSRASEGRLEVLIGGEWGTVCDDEFDVNDAKVACRMLGYFDFPQVVKAAKRYGEGSGNILMDDVNCQGSENDLGDCLFTGASKHDCVPSEAVGLQCRVTVDDVRLVNGSSASEGRLEVLIDGHWGTVCDDEFDVNDATVACRMLGYSGVTPQVRGEAFYGWGSPELAILMSDLGCTGSENNLGLCPHTNRARLFCGHYEDVGIVCG